MLNTAHKLPDIRFHTTRESDLAPFCARLHLQIEGRRFHIPQRPSLDKAKCQNKGGIFFYFVSPCLYLSLCCTGASTYTLIYLTIIRSGLLSFVNICLFSLNLFILSGCVCICRGVRIYTPQCAVLPSASVAPPLPPCPSCVHDNLRG